MFQPAILGLCVSFLADLLPVGSGARVDLATGARAELNAGRIPVTSVQDSAPGTEQTLVLRAGVRLISQTSSLSLIYRPRYYLRLPDALEIGRPLLLHDIGLAWTAELNRRLSLSWRTRASAGELPLSGLLLVFDPGTGKVNASVVPVFRVNSNLSMTAETGKRQTTNATLSVNHNDSFGSNSAFERSETLGLALTHSLTLSKRTSIGISTLGGYVWPETTPESATIGGLLFISQKIRAPSSIRLAAGLTQAWVRGGASAWPLPTTDLTYTTSFSGKSQRYSLNVTAGTRAFLDVLVATYRPQAFVGVGLTGQILTAWTFGTNLLFSTDISGPRLVPGGQPTQLNLEVPVGYRISDNLLVSSGLRVALSAPALSEWTTSTSNQFQDQVSVFAALDWTIGSEKSRGVWLR